MTYLTVIIDTFILGTIVRLYGIWIHNYLYMQSVHITTNAVSLNPTHDEVYLIQNYVVKFVSDLRQVNGFLQVLRFHPPIKLTATI